MLKKWLLGMAMALLGAACNGSKAECPTEGEILETAKLYIEHNATDADTGVHGLFGGEAWSELCVWAPDGQLILMVDPQGPLGDLTVSDLFFESREPPNDEFSMADLQTAFPEGEYKVGGTDFEGTPRVGTALFTHDVPAEPNITAPVLAEDEETASESVVSPVGLLVTWDPVTELTAGRLADRDRLRGDHHQGRPRRSARVLAPGIRRASRSQRHLPQCSRGVPGSGNGLRVGGPRPRGERQPDDLGRLLHHRVGSSPSGGPFPRRRSEATLGGGGQARIRC